MKLRSYSIAALAVNLAASLIVGTAFAQGAPAANTQAKPAVEATKPVETKTAESKAIVAGEKTSTKKIAAHKHVTGAAKTQAEMKTEKKADKTAATATAKQDDKTTAKVSMAKPAQTPSASSQPK